MNKIAYVYKGVGIYNDCEWDVQLIEVQPKEQAMMDVSKDDNIKKIIHNDVSNNNLSSVINSVDNIINIMLLSPFDIYPCDNNYGNIPSLLVMRECLLIHL
jgi:hypothetical protein